MIIRMYPIPPQRGNEQLAQSIALGKGVRQTRPERAKACVDGHRAITLRDTRI